MFIEDEPGTFTKVRTKSLAAKTNEERVFQFGLAFQLSVRRRCFRHLGISAWPGSVRARVRQPWSALDYPATS